MPPRIQGSTDYARREYRSLLKLNRVAGRRPCRPGSNTGSAAEAMRQRITDQFTQRYN
jgi:hypothetical protein